MKMKIPVKMLLLSLFVLTLWRPAAFSQTNSEKKLDEIVSQIRKEQKVDENGSIDPDKISNGLLEKLGMEISGKVNEGQQNEVYKRMGYRYVIANSKIKKTYAYPLMKSPGGEYMEPETDVTCPKCGYIWGFGGTKKQQKPTNGVQ
jgi:hypothetical protein